MLKRSKEKPSAQEAAKSAVWWNAAMAMGQLTTGVLTGNLGFFGESAHNAADAASYEAKRRAMECDPRRARRLRRYGATVLAIGGFVGIGGGTYHALRGNNEDARDIALVVAIAGASINTLVARRTHGAHHDHSHGHDAHSDSKLHAVTDAGTGWAYVGGLVAERYAPGAANLVVIANGTLSGAGAYITFKRISNGKVEGVHSHD